MDGATRILVVEDEPGIRETLMEGLREQGYECVGAEDGEEGVRLAAAGDVDIVILDIWLPGLDGYGALECIRRLHPELPVLMLTARDDLDSKISALDSGAEDYITKPFAFGELLARIRVLSRRAQRSNPPLEVGEVVLDPASREVWVAGKRVELSGREFVLLEYFMRRPGEDLSRQQILSDIWGYDFDPGSNLVDVYVRHLRRKVGRRGAASLTIATVRSVGYRLEVDSTDGSDSEPTEGEDR